MYHSQTCLEYKIMILLCVYFRIVSIESFAVGLKICAITAIVKKYKSIIKKTRKKHDEIVY